MYKSDTLKTLIQCLNYIHIRYTLHVFILKHIWFKKKLYTLLIITNLYYYLLLRVFIQYISIYITFYQIARCIIEVNYRMLSLSNVIGVSFWIDATRIHSVILWNFMLLIWLLKQHFDYIHSEVKTKTLNALSILLIQS